jgi:hypothetical protein
MSRNELSHEVAAELAALDSIIAGEPVGEEHLELAALVDSVRAQAPAFDAASEARVKARLAAARAPRRRVALARPRLALAGGTAFAMLIALAAVLASGVLGGSRAKAPLTPRSRPAQHSFAVAPASGAGAGVSATGGVALPAAGAGAAARRPQAVPNTKPGGRLVARGASLTLAASPGQMQDVANEVVTSTVRLGGIVERSNVNVRGAASYASFSLSVPSGRLQALIGALSSLASVRSLEQSTSDITDPYDAASAALAEERAQHSALLRQLAGASTLAEQQAIDAKIKALDAKIAAASRHVARLLSRGHNATVTLAIVASRGRAGGISVGPVRRALDDAVAVLEVALAIALVALAILLPAGLVALALWWGAATLRQRSRERALALTR